MLHGIDSSKVMAAAVGRQRRWPKGQQRHVSCCETKSVLLGKYLVVDGANSKAAVNGVGCQGEEGTPAVAKHHHRLLVEPRPSGQGWVFFFFFESKLVKIFIDRIIFFNFKYAFIHLSLYTNALRIFILTVGEVSIITAIHFI